MTSRKVKSVFMLLSLFVLFLPTLAAEIITAPEYGYSLDLPEGFEIHAYSNDGKSILFNHTDFPVYLLLKVNEDKTIRSSSECLKSSLENLSATYDINTFKWSKEECSLTYFTFTLADQLCEGWGACGPCQKKNSFVTVLCYAPKENAEEYMQVIASTVNSLCINDDFYNTPGIMTSYAYPLKEKINITSEIIGEKIESKIYKEDLEASQFVTDLEFSVLKRYADHKLWKEAWQRYYRILYRDSYTRIKDFSDKAYKTLYPIAKMVNPETPDITYAQYLLTWVQSFKYQRNNSENSSDFTPIPYVLQGQGCDCDSRALLINILLNSQNYETIMLISKEYSHALAATSISAPGQAYILGTNGKTYLIGETTANVTWGMISRDQRDRSKWIPVTFPQNLISKNEK